MQNETAIQTLKLLGASPSRHEQARSMHLVTTRHSRRRGKQWVRSHHRPPRRSRRYYTTICTPAFPVSCYNEYPHAGKADAGTAAHRRSRHQGRRSGRSRRDGNRENGLAAVKISTLNYEVDETLQKAVQPIYDGVKNKPRHTGCISVSRQQKINLIQLKMNTF